MKTLGCRLKSLRKKMQLTGEEFGVKMNVSKPTVSLWESDKRTPNAEMLQKIANFFDVSVDYLITGKESTFTKDGYYRDPEAAEYAEYLRTRPEAKLLFSASKDMSKEDMEEVVNYIEYLKSKHK